MKNAIQHKRSIISQFDSYKLLLKTKVLYGVNLKLKFYRSIIFVIILISFSTVSNSKNVFAGDIEKFASKLFNHYEYDDKITNYLKSIFSFGSNGVKNSPKNALSNSKTKIERKKSSIKIKSKNKLTYNFENGQSIQINPTNIDQKIIYNSSPFTYFEIKKDSISYGINVDF